MSRQHYVPRFYLREFSNEENDKKMLHVYDLHRESSFSTTPTNLAVEGEFYDISEEGIVDDTITSLEKSHSKSYNYFVDSPSVEELPDKHRYGVSHFVSLQNIRTRQFRNVVQKASESVLDSVEEGEIEEDEEGMEFIERTRTEEGAAELHAELMGNAVNDFAKLLYEMKWVILENKTDTPFVTSDSPFSYHNPILPEKDPEHGVERPGSQIHFPLTPSLSLQILDPVGYSIYPHQIRITDDSYALFLNELQLRGSERQIFSSEEKFDFIIEHIENGSDIISPGSDEVGDFS